MTAPDPPPRRSRRTTPLRGPRPRVRGPARPAPRPPRARRSPDTPPATPPDADTGGHLEYANSLLGAGSFVVALMLYAGYLYVDAFYSYFHLGTFAVGFDSLEFALRSLRLVTLPVFAALAVLVLIPYTPELMALLGVEQRQVRAVREYGHTLARLHPFLIVAGAVLMALWPLLGGLNWIAPLCVAVGLLLGQTSAATARSPRRRRAWERAVSLVVAGVFLMWVVALAAGDLGRRDARRTSHRLVNRVAVVVLSTERLSLTGPDVVAEDLGKGLRYRYRYSGLRLLVERDHRYYVLPLGWREDRDATFVIEDDDTVRVELRPGARVHGPGPRN
ncbi:hypothetical protein [Streptomyces sp. AN091965]|uniref:hypothetical protein n=1 Tax=Streptomyces sp. AN091965 TaxID=2927803 RepID=UPI001F604936|nr:hypothetical protein [Streptomyces sp. AN091965]MCI3935151.1 hypothetical protein [Streptomyces sp. AN091965]